ncbi:MAG: hypothetical protein F6K58_22180 [Symploca sp. SIO2E9]|nr:hypothetical protein [Symploca sp. SIO2E9]
MSEKKSGGTSKPTLQTRRIEIPTKMELTPTGFKNALKPSAWLRYE